MGLASLFGRRTSSPREARDTAADLLQTLVRRQLVEAETGHEALLTGFIEAQLPVHLTVPMARVIDSMAICRLDDVCQEIAKQYAPGARITVCTSGVVRLQELNTLIRHIDAAGVDIVDLNEFDPEPTDTDLHAWTRRCFPRAVPLLM